MKQELEREAWSASGSSATTWSVQNSCLGLNHFHLSPIQMPSYNKRKLPTIHFSPATSIWLANILGQELSLTVCLYNAQYVGNPSSIRLSQECVAHSKWHSQPQAVQLRTVFYLSLLGNKFWLWFSITRAKGQFLENQSLGFRLLVK